MPTALLQAFAESNHWEAIFPELMLAGAALFLLIAEIILPKSQHRYIPLFAIGTLTGVLAGLALRFDSGWIGLTSFGGLLRHSFAGQVARVFFTVSALGVCALAALCLPRSKMPRVEFYHIVLVITAALMLLAQSAHFAMLFVALETVTIGFYILVSYHRTNALTLEAGLKYLVTGALSSAIMLFGIVLLYGAVGRNAVANGWAPSGFSFEAVSAFLAQNPDSFLGIAGALLVLAGVAFKVGAFPFQIWIPDVYQGAPTPVTAFLATASKAAGFAVMLTLCRHVFAPLQSILVPVLSLLAAATLLFGNLAALTQRNVKRLMGLSGVSHAGFLLIGVTASFSVAWAPGAVWFYLFTYLAASLAVFGVMAHLAGTDDATQELEHYDDLAKRHPLLGGVLAIGVGSLAGIPPLAGFMGKLLIFIAAFYAHLYGLLAVAIVAVVVSIYYYFGWIRAAWYPIWRPENTEAPTPTASIVQPNLLAKVLLGGVALVTVALGFFQAPLTQWLAMK